jgi:hypothetical protein
MDNYLKIYGQNQANLPTPAADPDNQSETNLSKDHA